MAAKARSACSASAGRSSSCAARARPSPLNVEVDSEAPNELVLEKNHGRTLARTLYRGHLSVQTGGSTSSPRSRPCLHGTLLRMPLVPAPGPSTVYVPVLETRAPARCRNILSFRASFGAPNG